MKTTQKSDIVSEVTFNDCFRGYVQSDSVEICGMTIAIAGMSPFSVRNMYSILSDSTPCWAISKAEVL